MTKHSDFRRLNRLWGYNHPTGGPGGLLRNPTQLKEACHVDENIEVNFRRCCFAPAGYGDRDTAPVGASIPAAFIDPKWDLMYFVEVVDRAGAGRMYPDLERETPYVVIAVKR